MNELVLPLSVSEAQRVAIYKTYARLTLRRMRVQLHCTKGIIPDYLHQQLKDALREAEASLLPSANPTEEPINGQT